MLQATSKVPTFFIIRETPEALESSWESKEAKPKTKQSTLPQLHKQGEQRRRSAKTSARSRNIPPLLWLSTLCTSAYFSSRGLCSAHISHRGEIPRPGCTNNIKRAGSPRFTCARALSGMDVLHSSQESFQDESSKHTFTLYT